MIILAIDAGNEETAFVIWDSEKKQILNKNKLNNKEFELNLNLITSILPNKIDIAAIETISSYGMPVAQNTFDTAIFVGFLLCRLKHILGIDTKLIFRGTVKIHHCHSLNGINDAAVNLVLKQKYGEDNTQKKRNNIYWNKEVELRGANKYMSGDIWAAFALATYISEPKDYGIKNIMEREHNKLSTFFKDYTL